MGTLSYTLPTLGASGTQPATDVTAALSALKTELTALMETTNLADNGISDVGDIVRSDTTYAEFSKSVEAGPGAGPETFKSITIPSGVTLAAVWMKMVVVNLGVFPTVQLTVDGDAVTADTANGTYYTMPGDADGTSSWGAPILVSDLSSTLSLGLEQTNYIGSGSATVSYIVVLYGGFS